MRKQTMIGAATVVALLMSVSVTQAGMITPDILYCSYAFSAHPEGDMVDGESTTFANMRDEVSGNLVTGYVIFDMGTTCDLTGFSLAGRSDVGSVNPSDIDFYYFTNGVASDPGSSANITGSNYTLIDNATLTSLDKSLLSGAAGENSAIVWDNPVTTRYIAMKINDSHASTTSQIADVNFLTGNWISPSSIVDVSGTDYSSASGNIIDGETTTYSVIGDDTSADDPDAVTGHVIFDLGSSKTIDGAMLASRHNLSVSSAPSAVDFFYFEGDNPSGVHIAITSHTFSSLNDGNAEVADWTDAPITARYIGMEVNDSYHAAKSVYQIGEITFSEVPTDVPEPSTFILLLSLFAGLVTLRSVKK